MKSVKRAALGVAAMVMVMVGIVGVSANPASAAPGDPVTFMFARGVDDAAWYRVREADTWGPWQSLGGAVTGSPRAQILPDGRLMVFARGMDGQLWMRETFDAITWGPWTSLGGLLVGDPVVVATPWVTEPGEADLMVIVRGVDNRVYVKSYLAGTEAWNDWQGPGVFPIPGPVTAHADFDDRAVYVASVNSVTRVQSTGQIFGGFGPLPPSLLDAPVLEGPQGDLFGIGRRTDRQLGMWFGGLTEWSPLGGILTHAPIFGPVVDDLGAVLGRGQDAAVWSWSESGWASLGGIALDAPVGDYVDFDRFLLAVRGQDTSAWVRWFDHTTATWSGWEGLGGLLKDAPTLLMVAEGGDEEATASEPTVAATEPTGEFAEAPES